MAQDRQAPAKLAYGPPKLPAVLDLSRSTVYAVIRSGQLRSVRCGSRILVTEEAIREFLAGLPAYTPRKRGEQVSGTDSEGR